MHRRFAVQFMSQSEVPDAFTVFCSHAHGLGGDDDTTIRAKR